MINNKLVNLWRGDDPPPTLYHIWIKEKLILMYEGNEWISISDSETTIDQLNELFNKITKLEKTVDLIDKYTINNKLIKDNPVLSGNDLIINKSGNFIENIDSVSKGLLNLDNLLNTTIL